PTSKVSSASPILMARTRERFSQGRACSRASAGGNGRLPQYTSAVAGRGLRQSPTFECCLAVKVGRKRNWVGTQFGRPSSGRGGSLMSDDATRIPTGMRAHAYAGVELMLDMVYAARQRAPIDLESLMIYLTVSEASMRPLLLD